MITPEILKIYVPHLQLQELVTTRNEYFVREAAQWLRRRMEGAPYFNGIVSGDPDAEVFLHYFTETIDICITELNHIDQVGYGYKQDHERGSLSFHIFSIEKIVRLDFIWLELGEDGFFYMDNVMRPKHSKNAR